ncbi:energy transducer TonB [Winogradskyella sp. 3972H.M.0a.05]|uniref:energy transducer TonB n=1 Tax=Winogradskyella sp. 3972H.M.0a.05 TaxID=2950277 RepID=UPI00339B5AA3
MNSFYKLSIPNPCHEDWNAMTPKDKGRFCSSCDKVVIDFTKLSDYEIQDFIEANRHKQLCGHFKQSQLQSINLRIPSDVIQKEHNAIHLFTLLLLIVMGTSLFSCTTNTNDTKKIDSVEVVDSISQKTIDKDTIYNILGGIPKLDCSKSDSTYTQKRDVVIPKQEHPPILIGEVIPPPPKVELDGLIVVEEKYTKDSEDPVLGYYMIEDTPKFKNTPENLSEEEAKAYFSEKMNAFVTSHFNTNVCLEVEGIQRIYVQFEINKTGLVNVIKVRAPHPKLEKEAKRVIKLLPQFIPGRHIGTPVKVIYNLPIKFKVED